jgi:hypothetical protein
LLPFNGQTNETDRYNTMTNRSSNDNEFTSFLADVTKVESIKHRKEMINQGVSIYIYIYHYYLSNIINYLYNCLELEQIKHILAHKRVCMTAGGK